MHEALALVDSVTTNLEGTFIVPLETAEQTGQLLPLMALMLRAAGMKVLVLGRGPNLDKRAAALNIPFTGTEKPSGLMELGKAYQSWKHRQAKNALDNGPVLWPDIEFSQWAGPDCNGIPGLTIVNLGAMLAQGLAPQKTSPV